MLDHYQVGTYLGRQQALGVSTKVLLQLIGWSVPSCVLFANTVCSKPGFSSTAQFIMITSTY